MTERSTIIQGKFAADSVRCGIVVSRFNELVTGRLLEGALSALDRCGLDRANLTIVYVPGSFEIPLACKKLALSGQVDCIVALGAVIRGETSHFDLVANQAAGGVSGVSLECEVPVSFGVLTTDDTQQALERSGGKFGNKGSDAALAAIEMLNAVRQIDSFSKKVKVSAVQ